MDSDSSIQLHNPTRLKTLTSNVKYAEGNNLLHQFVLQNSHPNGSVSESCMNAVLLSMSDVPVNELNKKGYSPLHLAVLKDNLLMDSPARDVLYRVRNTSVEILMGLSFTEA